MAVTRRYGQPLQVVIEDPVRERLKRIADREGISQAQVVREIIMTGIDDRDRTSLQNYSD